MDEPNDSAVETKASPAPPESPPEPPGPVRYDFEDAAPPHLPPEMYEEWRETQLRMRAARQTHSSRWRAHELIYATGGALFALATIAFLRVGDETWKVYFALIAGAAAWFVAHRRMGRVGGALAYGGTLSVIALWAVATERAHPIGVVFPILYVCAGAAISVLAENRRWDEFSPF